MSLIKVTAAILKKNDKVLIAQRKRGDELEFMWEFPGGKIQEDETPQECLQRELLEELGIDTIVLGLYCTSQYDYPHQSIELMAFKVKHIHGDIVALAHERVQWVKKEEMSSYCFAPADHFIVNKLLKDI